VVHFVRPAEPIWDREPVAEQEHVFGRRRGWSYRRPPAEGGAADEGQVFTCFQRDLERGFVPGQPPRLVYRLSGASVISVAAGFCASTVMP
jgi:deferrochelatase/peroxidase EfeB